MKNAVALLLGLMAVAAIPTATAQESAKNSDRLRQWLQRFPDADANKDGVLTTEEARAYQAARRKSRDGRNDKKRADGIAPDHANVKYGPHERHVFDIWLAKRKDGKPTPLALYIHGGGFRAGDKKSVKANTVRDLREAGITVAAINYRLTNVGPYPMQMHDGARAIQFLRLNAQQYKINKKRVACFGGSAGACMSLWLAFHDDLADRDNEDPVLRESTRLTCAAPYNGQPTLDYFTFVEWFSATPLKEHPALRPLFGMSEDDPIDAPELRKRMKAASPISYLTRDDPPVYQTYGGGNVKVTASSSPGLWVHHPLLGIKLKEAMDKLEIECHVEYKGGPKITAYKNANDFLIKKLNAR